MQVMLFMMVLAISTPVFAQTIDTRDSKSPVDISADSLEVLQKENKAVFSGNVIARQDNITLRADKMVVYKATDGAPDGNAISKIEVIGNVLLATSQEGAKADSGTYFVPNKLIMLDGNVVLTRDKNVLKGSRLEYSMATGKSLLTGGANAATLDGGKSGGRVRGLFVPKE